MKTAIKNTLLLVCFVIFTNAIVVNDGYPKNPNIDIINYIFKIELSDTTDEISVDLTVDVRFVGKGVKKMRLDLINKSSELENKGMTISSVTSNGKPLEYTHKNDEVFIHLKEPSKKNQREQIVVNYKGIPANGLKIGDNMHGDRTFFSDNWPNRGRHWLATVDHPSDKAMCEPIASWLYVLGAADFAVQYVDEFDGKSIQTWVFKQDRDAGFYDFAIPTKKALEFYSEYVGPFSYEKLANIQSNSVSGGMEAASAILYSASSVKGDRNTRWRNVVIHEIAHQWFGNAVTEYDWDDIWLSEGFATYFTLLFIEHEYGRDAFVDGLISSQKRVDAFYEKNPKYTIIHDNLKDMKDVTSSQTYQKGSWILHMLRGLVGTDTFWKGIQIYYKKYQDLNATTADFKSVMEEVSGRDLTVFFEQWLYKPGTLNLKGNWKYNKRKGEVTVEFNQVQKDGSVFEMPLEIELDFGNNKKQLEVIQLKGTSNSFQIKVVSEPKSIIVDPNLKD